MAIQSNVIVFLSTLATEFDWEPNTPFGGEDLVFEGKLALSGGLEGGKDGAALPEELVQLEGEGAASVLADQRTSAVEEVLQLMAAVGGRSAAIVLEASGGGSEGSGSAALEAVLGFRFDPEFGFGPAREGVASEGLDCVW